MAHLFNINMSRTPIFDSSRLGAVLALLLSALGALAQTPVIGLEVDASEAPRKLLHAKLHFPVHPGKMTLLYPKWLPGEHGPNGPITDLVDLRMSAGNTPVEWTRDDEDMFALHVNVPGAVSTLDVSFNFLLPPSTGDFSSGASATPELLDLSWNEVLLYPQGSRASDLRFSAKLKLPSGWHFGTALPVATQSANEVEFSTVSLETLIDSPVITGAFFRSLELTPSTKPPHFLDMVADSAGALDITPADTGHFTQLVAETGALFGARHYQDYHFLLTLSDHVAHFGLEHHESSDNRVAERYLVDEQTRKLGGFLLCHEMVHSWNGKYRRPAGLATPGYEQPMKGELLWVYEGLTDYLGIVLATRCGLWTNSDFQDYLALETAQLDAEEGRTWRPLSDTAVAAQLLYLARPEGAARRRGVDFYEEGDLIWLEVDVMMRQLSGGKHSIDDFCKRFYGGGNTPPKVIPYTFDNIVNTLNEIVLYDWRRFFQARVYTVTPHAPLGGVIGAGWQLGYTNQPSDRLKTIESIHKYTDVTYSLGFVVNEDGYIKDVYPGTPSDKAGMAPAMKLLAVNGRQWTPELLRGAIKLAKTNKAPISLLLQNEDFYKTYDIDYHEGEKYPILERDASKPDLLAKILKSAAQ